MASETLTSLLLGVLTFGFVVPQILEYLQVSMPLKQVPSILAEYLNDAKLLEAKAYQKDNFKFKAITSSFPGAFENEARIVEVERRFRALEEVEGDEFHCLKLR